MTDSNGPKKLEEPKRYSHLPRSSILRILESSGKELSSGNAPAWSPFEEEEDDDEPLTNEEIDRMEGREKERGGRCGEEKCEEALSE